MYPTQHTTQTTINTLANYDLTAEQVANKLKEVIAKTEGLITEQNMLAPSQDIFIEVMPTEELAVSRSSEYMTSTIYTLPVKCAWCPVIQGVDQISSYTISNYKNHHAININYLYYHLITEHCNFGAGNNKVDPIETARVLGLIIDD